MASQRGVGLDVADNRRTVRFVYWHDKYTPGGMALSSVERHIVVLPQTGDAYWHQMHAHRIAAVTNDDPPEIHVEFDEERDAAFYAMVPEGAIIDAGRSGDDGEWHAEVYESDRARAGHTALGRGFGRDCDAAVGMAIGEANERLQQRPAN